MAATSPSLERATLDVRSAVALSLPVAMVILLVVVVSLMVVKPQFC